MIVYIVAALEALVYLRAVPVYVALRLDYDGMARVGAGIAAFDRRAAVRHAAAARPKARKKPRLRLSRWARQSLRRVAFERIRLRGRVGLGDAAATAMACGMVQALAGGLFGGAADVDVAPDFDAVAPRVALQGMLRARSGQIIIAAARGAMEIISGRIAQWTDRSKAS